MRAATIGSWLLLLGGCSSDAHGPTETQGGASGAGEGGGLSSTHGGTDGGARAGVSGESAAEGGAGGADDGGGAGGAVGLVELPAGSREVDNIVNLVDAEAAKDIDGFLQANGSSDLTRPLNLFLTYYEERYDFVFLFTDHTVPNGAAGRFRTITSQPSVGTGAVTQYLASGFQTNGRLKGTMAVEYGEGPLAHEIGHYWAVFLDASFGFGVGKTYNSPVHWGYAGVNGKLGGFDPKTLVCQTPMGGAAMTCKPMANGRYRYIVGSFSPGGNDVPYAPLELYLLGLASVDEAPAEIPVLKDADLVPGSYDPKTNTEVLDAAGLSTVKMSDITARHGVVTQLPDKDRHFTSAFVVVSAAPVSDAVIAEVSQRAAAFGDRGTYPLTPSFASETGNRATMSTVLGPRRTLSDPPPPPRPPFTCDVLAKDCDAGLACYGTYCALPGSAAANAACKLDTDCVSGARCVYLGNTPTGQCAQYCDPTNAQAPLACAKLCTSAITLVDDKGNPVATVCRPQ